VIVKISNPRDMDDIKKYQSLKQEMEITATVTAL
jgi:hypothetical protein